MCSITNMQYPIEYLYFFDRVLHFSNLLSSAISTKSKSIYLNKSLDIQVLKDTDTCPTKENNTTMTV